MLNAIALDTTQSFQIEGSKSYKQTFEEQLREFLGKYNDLIDNYLEAYHYCPDTVPCCENEKQLKYSHYANRLFALEQAYAAYIKSITDRITASDETIKPLQEKAEECKKKKKELEEAPTSNKPQLQREYDALRCDENEAELVSLKKVKEADEALKRQIEKLFGNITKITDEEIMRLVLFNNNLSPTTSSILLLPSIQKAIS